MTVSPPERSAEDMREAARSRLAALDPTWTDHNVSNPGVMIVELLAWLTDGLLFHTEQHNEDAHRAFLELLAGEPLVRSSGLDRQVLEQHVLRDLADVHRIVTADDAVTVIEKRFPNVDVVTVLHEMQSTPLGLAPHPESQVVVVRPADLEGSRELPAEVRNSIRSYVEERRLVTARIDVVHAMFVDIAVGGTVVPKQDATPEQALASAQAAVVALFDHHHGGRQGTGWPIGRTVDRIEVGAAIDAADHVEYVTDLSVREVRERSRPTPTVSLDLHQFPVYVVDDPTSLIAVESGHGK